MDFSEKWGTDVEEAVKLALFDLKLTRDEVEVTVLEEPSRGFFGIGSKLAKVRVEKKKVEEELKPEPVKETVNIVRPEPKKEKIEEKVKEFKDKQVAKERIEVNERPDNLVAIDENEATIFLKNVTREMGLELEIKAQGNDDSIYIDIEGRDAGTIIGKRGQTLDSIQYLTSLVVNKGKENYIRVIVDAENYRAKREKTLEQLANRLANKVIRTKKSVRLEPMNPYERKVIHSTLQNNPSIVTRSEGEEPYRRVIIELSNK